MNYITKILIAVVVVLVVALVLSNVDGELEYDRNPMTEEEIQKIIAYECAPDFVGPKQEFVKCD